MTATPRASRVALATAATRGIGYQIARGLAASGATAVLHARTTEEGHQTVADPVGDGADARRPHCAVADLAHLCEVRSLADEIAVRHRRVDVLVNNAATVGGARRRFTDDGHLIWSDLDRPARYTPVAAYAQSKHALTMLGQALATRPMGGAHRLWRLSARLTGLPGTAGEANRRQLGTGVS